jgi:thiamine kinase-like enzyme
MSARAAHAAGFAPRVEYATTGVMVSAFIEARTWDAADVRAAPDRIAALLRAFHLEMPAHISGPGFIFWPFHVIRDYGRMLTQAGSPFAPHVPGYLTLSAELEITQVPQPIVFGHHDLLPANFLDDGTKLWLIDFEYAGFGTAMFDLAGAASNAGMSDAETAKLLTAYFGHDPEPSITRAFHAMQCAALLREAMWAMVSALHLSANDVDYNDYARENLGKLDVTVARYRETYGDPA